MREADSGRFGVGLLVVHLDVFSQLSDEVKLICVVSCACSMIASLWQGAHICGGDSMAVAGKAHLRRYNTCGAEQSKQDTTLTATEFANFVTAAHDTTSIEGVNTVKCIEPSIMQFVHFRITFTAALSGALRGSCFQP